MMIFYNKKKRPPIFTNRRAHDAILFHNLTLPPPYAAMPAVPQKPARVRQATTLHPTSATRTRFQCSHPKQADLCMEKESHRITRGILCS